MPAITVRRLWREDNVGLAGWIGAELLDGTLVALCSVEKWNLGSNDSLRQGWVRGERVFSAPKRVHTNVSERELRLDGLGSGALKLIGKPVLAETIDMVKRYNTCTVLRRCLVSIGTLDNPNQRQEWQTAPCGTPLFSEKERTAGVCRSCASGWTHPHNYPVKAEK